MKLRYLALLLFSSALLAQSSLTNITPGAAYVSIDGVNWNPYTNAAAFGALRNPPAAIGLYCQASLGAAWTPCTPGGGGGGTFNALTGDATSTSTGGATTVKGINGTLLSGLGTGFLFNTTSTGVPSIASTTNFAALLSGASGCTTAGSTYSPQSNACIAGGGTTTNPVTFAATGGASPGTMFNGSATVTVSASTVGAAPASGSTNYVQTAPTGTQVDAQPTGTQLNVTGDPNALELNGIPASAVASVTNVSQTGCAQSDVDLATGAVRGSWTAPTDPTTCLNSYMAAHAVSGKVEVLVLDHSIASSGLAGPSQGGFAIVSSIPAGMAVTNVTAWSITSNVVTLTTKPQTLQAGQGIILNGFPTSTFLNGTGGLPLLITAATSTSITASSPTFTHANGSATEAGMVQVPTGNGIFQLAGAPGHLIQNGPATNANICPGGYMDPGYNNSYSALPALGGSVAVVNLFINGNYHNVLPPTGSFVLGSPYCYNTGIAMQNLDGITLKGNYIYETNNYNIFLRNTAHDYITGNTLIPYGPNIAPVEQNLDGVHIDAPAQFVWIDNNVIASGDDAWALNSPEGWPGAITDVTVANNIYAAALSGGRMYTNSTAPPSGYPNPLVARVTVIGNHGNVAIVAGVIGNEGTTTKTRSDTMYDINYIGNYIHMVGYAPGSPLTGSGYVISDNTDDITFTNNTVEGINNATANGFVNFTAGATTTVLNLNNDWINRVANTGNQLVNLAGGYYSAAGTNHIGALNITGGGVDDSYGGPWNVLPFYIYTGSSSTIGKVYSSGVSTTAFSGIFDNRAQITSYNTSNVNLCGVSGSTFGIPSVCPAANYSALFVQPGASEGSNPAAIWLDNFATTNEHYWDTSVSTHTFSMRTASDDYTGANPIFTVTRSGYTPTGFQLFEPVTVSTTASNSTGKFIDLSITPTYTQTSTASATDLLISRTETTVGSGAQFLIEAAVGGTDKFTVSDTGLITSGTPAITDTGVVSQFTGSTNSYFQSIWQNTNAGATASTDLVLNNDQGTSTTHYLDVGINSSGFTGSGSMNIAGAGYLYTITGDLAIGTQSANATHFVYNNGATDSMLINANGVSFPTLTTTPSSTSAFCPSGTLGAMGLCALPASGFPITIGSTSVAASSTTTTVAGLTSLTAANLVGSTNLLVGATGSPDQAVDVTGSNPSIEITNTASTAEKSYFGPGTTGQVQLAYNRTPITGTIPNTAQSAAYETILGGAGPAKILFSVGSAVNTAPTQTVAMFSGGVQIGNSGSTSVSHSLEVGTSSQFSVSNTGVMTTSAMGIMGQIDTYTNCSNTASPAVCTSAAAGQVQVAASATSLTINTTAVNANSRIGCLTYSTVGITAPTNMASLIQPYVSAISAGVSFTLTLPVAPLTNAVNLDYCLIN